MPTRTLTRIVPHLWYIKEAEEAARFYTSIFPKSRIDRVVAQRRRRRMRRVPVVWPAVFRDECRGA